MLRTISSLLLLTLWAACATEPTSSAFVDIMNDRQIDPLSAPENGAAVLIFISTDCPIANGYSPQLKELVKAWQGRPVQVTLVHVDPELTPSAARKHAQEYGHECPIVIDRSHRLVARSGATITPEAVVFAADGRLQYRGRINNWYGDIGRKRLQPSKHELRDAVDAVLAKKAVAVARTEAVGCSIEPLDK